MSPSDFRSKKLATLFAYGGPRSSCVRPVFVLRSATHSDRGYHTDFTPCRRPPILSLPALTPQTPTKQAALRLRGGRRTPLIRYRSLASCTPSVLESVRTASGPRQKVIASWTDCRSLLQAIEQAETAFADASER